MLLCMMDDKVVYFDILQLFSIDCSVVHLVSVKVTYTLHCSDLN